MKNVRLLHLLSMVVAVLGLLGVTESVSAYTANKVWFEFLEHRYRVTVNYTIPELKEFRESHVEFKNKKDAEAFYWKLIRGADFYPPDVATTTRYENQPKLSPKPW